MKKVRRRGIPPRFGEKVKEEGGGTMLNVIRPTWWVVESSLLRLTLPMANRRSVSSFGPARVQGQARSGRVRR